MKSWFFRGPNKQAKEQDKANLLCPFFCLRAKVFYIMQKSVKLGFFGFYMISKNIFTNLFSWA